MKLTGTEINKAYSEQLAKLLLDGYRLVVARENGSLEKNNADFAKVVLEKDGKRYEFGYWYENINQSTGKHTLTLTESVKYSWWSLQEEVNNLLSEPYTYIAELEVTNVEEWLETTVEKLEEVISRVTADMDKIQDEIVAKYNLTYTEIDY